MDLEYDGLPKDWLQQIRDKVVNLTKDDIQRAAKAHFNPERLRFSQSAPATPSRKCWRVSAKCRKLRWPRRVRGKGKQSSGSCSRNARPRKASRWTRAVEPSQPACQMSREEIFTRCALFEESVCSSGILAIRWGLVTMPLEDELSDILKKARNGQQRSVAEVARASGLSEVELSGLERGNRRGAANRCARLPGRLD